MDRHAMANIESQDLHKDEKDRDPEMLAGVRDYYEL